SGTIISNSWILTAAHCVPPFSTTQVYSGISNGIFADEAHEIYKSLVVATFPHPNNKSAANDIALIKLEELLVFGETVSPICLLSKEQLIPDDGTAIVFSYYSNQASSNNITSFLHSGDLHVRDRAVPLIQPDLCRQRITAESDASTTSSHICAGSVRNGTENKGNPLLMKSNDGRWFQIGIASHGVGGGAQQQGEIMPATRFRGAGGKESSQEDLPITHQKEACEAFLKKNNHGKNFTSCFPGFISLHPDKLGLYNCDFKDKIGRLYLKYADVWGEDPTEPHDYSMFNYGGKHSFEFVNFTSNSRPDIEAGHSIISRKGRLWQYEKFILSNLLMGLYC
ncbi:hypothetical protein PFISCL1PPCAC_8437, partial [Pristionchus fissidentatus]